MMTMMMKDERAWNEERGRLFFPDEWLICTIMI
jgi:hypothetical protein